MTKDIKRIGAIQAMMYAQVMALDEMVNRGEITREQEFAIARRTDEIISNMMKGLIHEKGENGVYEAREPTDSERAQLTPPPSSAVGVLKIGD